MCFVYRVSIKFFLHDMGGIGQENMLEMLHISNRPVLYTVNCTLYFAHFTLHT